MKVRGAGGVDDDPIARIGGDDRREVLQHPQRQPVQRLGVSGQIGVLDHRAPHQRLGFGGGHADAQTGGPGRRRPPLAPPSVSRPGPPGSAAPQAEALRRPFPTFPDLVAFAGEHSRDHAFRRCSAIRASEIAGLQFFERLRKERTNAPTA